ncbi:MAG: hypothetical protein QGI45_13795 [Myxococcota bacterium]|jgi:hypothetical protein|nr:hypothetical protein [Myxococcota bacterium]
MISEINTQDIKPTKNILIVEKLIFLGILLSYSYFFSAGEWNQISRYDLIFTLVEPHTMEAPLFSIDRFIESPKHNFNTGDWAQHDGHYYSNKAPGSALLGSAVYSILYALEHSLLGLEVKEPGLTIFNLWIINIFVSVLPLAFSALCFFRLVLMLSRRYQETLIATIFLYWGSLLFPYATQLWGTTSACAFIIIGLYFLYAQHTRSLLLCGIFWGLAVLTEYAAAPAVFFLVAFSTTQNSKRRLLSLATGLFGPAVVYMFYHSACFGNFWKPASFYSNPEFAQAEQVFGMFDLINTEALGTILYSNRIGIFLHMPILLFALIGLYFASKNTLQRKLAATLALAALVQLVLNSTFLGWHGGFVVGARYQIPVLGLYALALCFVPQSKILLKLMKVALGISMANMLVIASLTPIYAIKDAHYLGLTEYYRRFFDGNIAQHTYHVRTTFPDYPPIQHFHTFNIGELLGLKGLATLAPLLVGLFLFVIFSKNLLKRFES